MSKTLVTIILAALVLPATAVAFHSDGIPVIYAASSPGSASYAVRYEHGGGNFAIDLYGSGPATAQSTSAAVFVFDSNKNLVFGFAFTGHSSPDRLILSPAGGAGDAAGLPSWLDISVETWDSTTDAACTFFCVGLSGSNAPAGTYYYLLWLSGVSANSFEVRSGGGSVAANAGPAYSIGDAEIRDGTVNAQAQETAAPGAVAGAKVMLDASTVVGVNDKLYGFFGASDFKLACQFAVGVCVWKSSVTYTCSAVTRVNCDTTRTSWSGPTSGSGFGAFLGTPAGDYTLSVDSKVDAYGPNAYNPQTGTWLFLGEDYTYFTAADNKLP